MQATPPSALAKFSPWAVRLVAAWVIGVSAIKMFKGSPASIPLVIRENSPLGEDATFYATISIELAFSFVALVLPRWGWALMTALMSVFIAVLVYLASIGAASCGCFGGALAFSPLQMLAVDGTLFALMLATQPWRQLAPRAVAWVPLAAGAALGALAPWLLIHNEPVELRPQVVHTRDAPLDGAAASAQPASAQPPRSPTLPSVDGTPLAPANADKPRLNSADGNIAVRATSLDDWQLPDKLPRWARLRPPEWNGKSIHETDLAIWMNTRQYPTDATWILYLETCEHCRDYLNRLESEFERDPRIYVFVCLSTPDDERERKIERRPPGEIAKLPQEVSWVVGPELPPWELVLEDGIVKSVARHAE